MSKVNIKFDICIYHPGYRDNGVIIFQGEGSLLNGLESTPTLIVDYEKLSYRDELSLMFNLSNYINFYVKEIDYCFNERISITGAVTYEQDRYIELYFNWINLDNEFHKYVKYYTTKKRLNYERK